MIARRSCSGVSGKGFVELLQGSSTFHTNTTHQANKLACNVPTPDQRDAAGGKCAACHACVCDAQAQDNETSTIRRAHQVEQTLARQQPTTTLARETRLFCAPPPVPCCVRTRVRTIRSYLHKQRPIVDRASATAPHAREVKEAANNSSHNR